MKFIIQRVNKASVCVENKIVGAINEGYVVFVGISSTDTPEIADKMNITPNNASAILLRMRNRLREHLTKEGFEI